MGFYHARHSQVQIPSQPTKSSIQPISQNGVSKKKIKKRYASSEEEEEEREATKKEEKTNVEFNVESNMESHPTRLARYKNAVKEDSEHISQTKVSEVKKLSDPNIKLDDDLNVEKIRSSDEDKIEMSRVRARPKPALKPFQPRKSGNQTKKKVILVSTSEDEEDDDDDDDE